MYCVRVMMLYKYLQQVGLHFTYCYMYIQCEQFELEVIEVIKL